MEYALKAAEGDKETAMDMIALMYENGYGCPKDPAKAFEWYLKAAQEGWRPATVSAAKHLHEGIGVEKDDFKAAMLLQEGAARTYGPAMKMLGEFYLEGWGVKRDLHWAKIWLDRAQYYEEDVEALQKRLKELTNKKAKKSGRMA